MEILILILLCGACLPLLLRPGAVSSKLLKRAPVVLLFFVLLTGMHQSTALCGRKPGDIPAFPETAVKAAFIYNMTKFISWPMPKEPLTILVMGDSDLADTLRQLTEGEKMTAFRISEKYDPLEPRYQIIFTSRNISPQSPKTIDGKNTEHSLFITDNRVDSDSEHMIYISRKNSRLILRIDISKTKSRNIYISPQLLNISDILNTSEDRNP